MIKEKIGKNRTSPHPKPKFRPIDPHDPSDPPKPIPKPKPDPFPPKPSPGPRPGVDADFTKLPSPNASSDEKDDCDEPCDNQADSDCDTVDCNQDDDLRKKNGDYESYKKNWEHTWNYAFEKNENAINKENIDGYKWWK